MIKEIPISRGLVTLVDDIDFPRLNNYRWYAWKPKECSSFYVVRNHLVTDEPTASTKMHREILNAPKGLRVDHIDGNGLNNTRANLRLATHQQNMCNRPANANNKSGFKGVSWFNRDSKWVARLETNGKVIFLGYFDDLEEAARVYDAAARKHFGEYARCNFPLEESTNAEL